MDQEEVEILEDALKAAGDGSELVRSLLAFSSRQRLVPQPHDLKTILSEFQRSLARALGESVDLTISVNDALDPVFVDRTHFETALLNLCINARDAIDRSGKIVVKGRSVTISPSQAHCFGIDEPQGKNFVMVEITDDGCGIPSDLLTKVTEPFFSTKEACDGSGLGLSSVAGFVKQSGGGLQITSELGFGTSVKLLLPLADTIEATVGAEEGQKPYRSETDVVAEATILVVDDEPRIRQVAARWLERDGYTVLQAQDAESALEHIEGVNGEIDVLFSDIVMPGKMDGRDLANSVSTLFPDMSIQLTTGYEHERQHRALGSGKDFPVISKPYDLQELSSTIRGLLAKKLARA